MGKSFAAATTKLAKNLRPSKHPKPASRVQRSGEGDKSKKMEGTSSVLNNSNNSSGGGSGSGSSVTRLPLSDVVSDCVKRWFKDTLKEAKAGDINMQVLLGQMYYSGYGVPRDVQKGSVWMTRASRTRSSVWKVSDKHPGYNASDSDSDEIKAE